MCSLINKSKGIHGFYNDIHGLLFAWMFVLVSHHE